MQFERDRLLAPLSTLQIGGAARLYAEPETDAEWAEALSYTTKHEIPYHLLGKGSNTLFADAGFDGLVLAAKDRTISWQEGSEPGSCFVTAAAGCSFPLLGRYACRRGLAGLAFAGGIPGTVGGAVCMNAGALGETTADTLFSVDYLHCDGSLHTLSRSNLQFGYRSSPFQEMRGVILRATFLLQRDEKALQAQREQLVYRLSVQPYDLPSAGSVFKNPSQTPQGEQHSAGRLIDACGLRGSRHGDAQISEKHANFIVNRGQASSTDVLALVECAHITVLERFGIALELELQCVTSCHTQPKVRR